VASLPVIASIREPPRPESLQVSFLQTRFITQMPSPAALLARRALLVLMLATPACRVEDRGLGGDGGVDGPVGVGVADTARDMMPVIKSGSATLPQAGAKSMAVWTSAGGGAATAPSGAVGVTLSCVPTTSTVVAPSGATITLGHFADTVE
jgi:hypothetical protein